MRARGTALAPALPLRSDRRPNARDDGGSRMPSSAASASHAWPSLALEAWADTCATLHMWTQIVGKIRLAQSPWINHSWHVTLYLTARGLTTSPIPYGTRTFQVDFDFIDHQLVIQTSDGAVRIITLQPTSVSDFYGEVMTALQGLNLNVSIHT